MAIKYKTVTDSTTTKASNLNQLIDVVQEDVSSSVSRKKYQVFVTGGIGPGITSSLYQTVFDQDFSLQTANPILDMTVGLFWNSHFVTTYPSSGTTKTTTANIVSCAPGFSKSDSNRISFDKNAVMMREKVNNYRQMASHLLGNADLCFSIADNVWPGQSGQTIASLSTDNNAASGTGLGTIIHEALFLNVKRLFARDGIRKETFAMRVYRSASLSGFDDLVTVDSDGIAKSASQRSYYDNGVLQSSVVTHASIANYAGNFPVVTGSNISYLSDEMATGTYMPFLPDIVADIGAQQNLRVSKAGDVARILTANGQDPVGLLFYDAGVAVMDMRKLFWADQHVYGRIDAMTSTTMANTEYVQGNTANAADFGTIPAGVTVIGCDGTANYNLGSGVENTAAKFIPDFLVSASIDNIVDHIAKVRFGSGSLTAMAFQNQTKIQSNIYFCRAEASEFNFSGNPTFTDSDTGIINTLEDTSAASTETSFTFITGVGLFNDQNELMAVAKLNRPIEKNDETELTLRIRLDF